MQLYPACFNANQEMDTTCNAIVNELELNIEGQGIADITGIHYFTNLYGFVCNANSISNLQCYLKIWLFFGVQVIY